MQDVIGRPAQEERGRSLTKQLLTELIPASGITAFDVCGVGSTNSTQLVATQLATGKGQLRSTSAGGEYGRLTKSYLSLPLTDFSGLACASIVVGQIERAGT